MQGLPVSLATLSLIACDSVADCMRHRRNAVMLARDTVAASSREALGDDVLTAKKTVAAANVILQTLLRV